MPIASPSTAAIAPAPPSPLLDDPREHFLLDPTYDFLNHGSFGSRPIAVLEAQTRRRAEFEARPIEWLAPERNGKAANARARHALASFVGARADDLVFVANATGGVNAVVRSLRFNPGDELLTTTHVYNAVRQTMRYLAERSGATYREVDVPLPLGGEDEVLRAIESALTDRTRLLCIDHVTSPTAVVFPVKRIVDACERRGIDVLIDGAHAPGMLPLNIQEIGAAYYTGNLHKWVCAPIGAAFLWVRPDRQKGIHPPTISHFLDQGLTTEFGWQATRDVTPWLCVEDALTWMGRLGWDRIMHHNHQMAVWVQAMLCERWGVGAATPLDGRMLGSMCTVPLPGQEILKKRFDAFRSVGAAIYERDRIEVPIVEWGVPPTSTAAPATSTTKGYASPQWWVRPCCQIYNRPEQYERLAEAVLRLVQ